MEDIFAKQFSVAEEEKDKLDAEMNSVCKRLKVSAEDACKLAEETNFDDSVAGQHDKKVIVELGASAWEKEVKAQVL